MTLGELIDNLKRLDPSLVVEHGFVEPHSYRGYYDELAFEPARGMSIRSMLEAAESAVGTTYEGYKGGEYTMHEHTPVHLALYGTTGEPITSHLVALWFYEDAHKDVVTSE